MEYRDRTLPIQLSPFPTELDSNFHNELLEIYNMVNNLTPEQTTLVEFWSDDAQQTATPCTSLNSVDRLVQHLFNSLGQL
jgi:hypothetical protein